jgi:hypothetical protein
MTDPAIHIFKRFVGKTDDLHTKLQDDFEFKRKDGRTESDVEHFAPNNWELDANLISAVEKYTDKHGYDGEDAEGNLTLLPKKEVLIAFKKELDTCVDGAYPPEDIIEEWMPEEDCCAYCYYGYECDVPRYINDIYKMLNLSFRTCCKVSRHDDFVVGMIVNSVALHILNYFLEKIQEEIASYE